MTEDRFTLRLVFFLVETSAVGLWFIFTGATGLDVYYRGILLEPFRTLEPVAYVVFGALPVISYFMRRSDRKLATLGFATFFGILMLVAVFELL